MKNNANKSANFYEQECESDTNKSAKIAVSGNSFSTGRAGTIGDASYPGERRVVADIAE
jgi:hypothetical protein